MLTIIVDDITEQCDINSNQMGHHRVRLVEASQLSTESIIQLYANGAK